MDLICVGLNHKICPVEIREQLAFSDSDQPRALTRLQNMDGIRESFLLSTCNRVELYARGTIALEPAIVRFLSEFHGLDEHVFASYLYCHHGEDAIEQLFRVASGLDSLVVGENEIHGQVRDAFRVANRMKSLDSILYQVVERSIRVGKRVRSDTRINDRSVSVSSIAVELAEKIFGRLSGERILVLGTGKMSERTLKHLTTHGAGLMKVASRTHEKALHVAKKFGAEPIGFEHWYRAMRDSDIVISSTSAPQPIVHFKDVKQLMIERRHKPICFIDIAVPRDIDPRVGELDDVYLYDIDDLKALSEANLRIRKKEIDTCEAIIDRELASFHQWHDYLEARPVIQKLTAYFDEIVEQEIGKTARKFKGKEKDLDLLVGRIKSSLLHVPLEKLKESAKDGSLERHLEALHALFELDRRESAPLEHQTKFSTEDE